MLFIQVFSIDQVDRIRKPVDVFVVIRSQFLSEGQDQCLRQVRIQQVIHNVLYPVEPDIIRYDLIIPEPFIKLGAGEQIQDIKDRTQGLDVVDEGNGLTNGFPGLPGRSIYEVGPR